MMDIKKSKGYGNASIFEKNARRVDIDSLNSQISSKINADEIPNSVRVSKEVVLDKYEQLMKLGTSTKIRFDACDISGNFSVMDNGVLVILPSSSVGNVQSIVNVYTTSRMLGVELALNIARVDRENNRVYCEIPRSVQLRSKDLVKNSINRELHRIIKGGSFPVVWGRIIRVDAKKAYVDILGQGIVGCIDVAYWQKCYTRSMLGMCNEGEYYQFEVMSQGAPRAGHETGLWALSRRNITPDVWQEIDFEALQAGGNLMVRCVEKPVGKTYWWGVSERTPGIEIMGDFTVKLGNKDIIEGITYKCKIKEIEVSDNHKRNRFTVIPFGVSDDDVEKVEAVRRLRKKTDVER